MKFYIDFQCQNITKRYSENRENAYLAMKNPSASRPLRRAPDLQPTSACFARMTSSLRRQYFLKEIWGPPNQILDPLLIYMCTGTYVNICARCYVSVIKPVAKRTVHR